MDVSIFQLWDIRYSKFSHLGASLGPQKLNYKERKRRKKNANDEPTENMLIFFPV